MSLLTRERGFKRKYLYLPPLADTAGRSPETLPLLEADKKGQNSKARLTTNNKPRSRWFASTLSCLHRLKEKHFFGILLPLPVTELTRKRALPKYLALLGLGKQLFSRSLRTRSICAELGREQETKGCQREGKSVQCISSYTQSNLSTWCAGDENAKNEPRLPMREVMKRVYFKKRLNIPPYVE